MVRRHAPFCIAGCGTPLTTFHPLSIYYPARRRSETTRRMHRRVTAKGRPLRDWQERRTSSSSCSSDGAISNRSASGESILVQEKLHTRHRLTFRPTRLTKPTRHPQRTTNNVKEEIQWRRHVHTLHSATWAAAWLHRLADSRTNSYQSKRTL